MKYLITLFCIALVAVAAFSAEPVQAYEQEPQTEIVSDSPAYTAEYDAGPVSFLQYDYRIQTEAVIQDDIAFVAYFEPLQPMVPHDKIDQVVFNRNAHADHPTYTAINAYGVISRGYSGTRLTALKFPS